MLGIAVKLGRPPRIHPRKNRLCEAFEQDRSRVIARQTRHRLLRLGDIRKRKVGGALAAAGEAGKQEGSAHQTQELAAAVFRQQRCGGGKLSLDKGPQCILVDQLLNARPEPRCALRETPARFFQIEASRCRAHRWHT